MTHRQQWLVIAVLWVAVLTSSIGAVYSRHEARRLFHELQQLNKQRDELDIQWGRLQIEQSTWATHGRIEKIARDDLGMTIPSSDELMVVQP